jgi:hypothetical protein
MLLLLQSGMVGQQQWNYVIELYPDRRSLIRFDAE